MMKHQNAQIFQISQLGHNSAYSCFRVNSGYYLPLNTLHHVFNVVQHGRHLQSKKRVEELEKSSISVQNNTEDPLANIAGFCHVCDILSSVNHDCLR